MKAQSGNEKQQTYKINIREIEGTKDRNGKLQLILLLNRKEIIEEKRYI